MERIEYFRLGSEDFVLIMNHLSGGGTVRFKIPEGNGFDIVDVLRDGKKYKHTVESGLKALVFSTYMGEFKAWFNNQLAYEQPAHFRLLK